MIKAVVFDLDDTLISEKQYIESGFKAVAKELNRIYSLNSEEIFNKMLELFNESSINVFNRILDLLNIKYSENIILDLIRCYREHTPEIEFFEDVIPVINKLKKSGYKLGIITDGYKETQLRKIDVLKCYDLFDEIIVTDELGREYWKPHEKPYKLMAEKMCVNFKNMIYIGDNVNKDFVTANKLGIKTVYINRENGIYDDMEVPIDFRANNNIRSLLELIELINEYIFV